jgi:hypothetical protein
MAGAAGAGAAVFLSAHKTPLLWLGIAMSLAGVLYLLRQVRGVQRAPGQTSAQPTLPVAGRSHGASAHVTAGE